MQFQTIHITDHAIQRWSERTTRKVNIEEITESIRKSKLITKKDFLPFCLPRRAETVYSFDGEVLFIFETVSINEFRLVTVIAEQEVTQAMPIEYVKTNRQPVNTREYLLEQKRKLELELAGIKKSDRQPLKDLLKEVEIQLCEKA